MRKVVVFAVISLVTGAVTVRADYISAVKDGNKAFEKKDFGKALELYNQAVPDLPVSPELDYNIGGALHGTGDYDGAIKHYEAALKSTDVNLEAQARYNLGNTYYRKKDYQHAIESYQESLKLNPTDMDSKFNLELARKMLKEQMKPQQNQQQNKDQQKQEQDKKDQQNQKDQQNKQDQKNKDQQKQDQDKQNQQQDQQKQQNQQNQQNQSKKMSKEDAARILNALKDDEQDLQKKVKRENAKGDYIGKDW